MLSFWYFPASNTVSIIPFRVKDRHRAEMCLHLMGSNLPHFHPLSPTFSLSLFLMIGFPKFSPHTPVFFLSLVLSSIFPFFNATFHVNKIESKWNGIMTITIKVSQPVWMRVCVCACVCLCAFREPTCSVNYYITESWKMLSVFRQHN